MSGFDDSDFVRLLNIVEKTDLERESETFRQEKSRDYSGDFDRMMTGLIFAGTEPDLIYGNVYIKDGIIVEIEETKNVQNISRHSGHWIVPRFVNAHTHIGDTLLKDPVLGPPIQSYAYARDLDALVRPPNGLKHKFLSQISQEEAVLSMESAIFEMYQNGISVFADFRENGYAGVSALIQASKNTGRDIHPIIFGRPTNVSENSFDENEFEKLLEYADGIGLSGANDMDKALLAQIASKTRLKRKKTAIHAGEKDDSDIESALSLNPDLLIHMTHANQTHLKAVSDADIPIAVCVRSNLVTGVGLPPILEMLENEISLCIGTDNMMLNSPDMFEELHFLSKIYGVSDAVLFKMATSGGANALGCRFTGSVEVGKKADLMVVNGKSLNLKYVKDPLFGLIRRARTDDILGIV